jgi:hypothetical protein
MDQVARMTHQRTRPLHDMAFADQLSYVYQYVPTYLSLCSISFH